MIEIKVINIIEDTRQNNKHNTIIQLDIYVKLKLKYQYKFIYNKIALLFVYNCFCKKP